MFLNSLKKVLEDTKLLHRFIYENSNFFEDAGKVDQKKYNYLQVEVFKKIANLKFGGDVIKFTKDPVALKTMQLYREYVKNELPFLLVSDNNPDFNPLSAENVDKASQYILSRLYPQQKTMAARG